MPCTDRSHARATRVKRSCHESVKHAPHEVSGRAITSNHCRCVDSSPVSRALALVVRSHSPAVASAATGIAYGLTDDAWLANGPGTVEDRVTTLDGLGVQVVRFTLRWDQIAPTEPANPERPAGRRLRLVDVDRVLDALHSRGIDVVLQLDGAPVVGERRQAVELRADSGRVVRRLRDRGRARVPLGPEVPDLERAEPGALAPPDLGVRSTSTRLLNPAYAAIHAVIPGAKVAGGGHRAARLDRRRLAARLDRPACTRRTRASTCTHTTRIRSTRSARPRCTRQRAATCTTVTMATLSRLERLVARNFPRARIWLTEYGYQSNPPDRILGVTPVTAGALHRGRRVRRIPHAARRPADPLPLSRRADTRAIPEWARHAPQHAQARAGRIRAPARRDRSLRIDDEPLGAAARAQRRDRRRPRTSHRRVVAHVRADQRQRPRLLPLAGHAHARRRRPPPR